MLCIKIKYNNVEMHKRQGEYMIRKNEVNINQFKEKPNLLKKIELTNSVFLIKLKMHGVSGVDLPGDERKM